MSVATLGRVERAESSALADTTVSSIDRAVRWRYGSAERVILGESPTDDDVPEVRGEEFHDTDAVHRRRMVTRFEPADSETELVETFTRVLHHLATVPLEVREAFIRHMTDNLASTDELITNVSEMNDHRSLQDDGA
jgi:hypothetical protein